MTNETIGSLLELLKIACKKAWENVVFVLLIGAVNSLIMAFSGEHSHFLRHDLAVPHSGSSLVMIIVNLIYLGSVCFAATTIALSKDNSIDGQLKIFGNFFITKGIKLFCALVVKIFMVTIGLILLVIPGIYISLRAYTMEFAAVLEDKWPIAAFNKSTEITNGNKWLIFGYLLVVSLMIILFVVLVFGALMALVTLVYSASMAGGDVTAATHVGMFHPEARMGKLLYLIAFCLQFAISVILMLQACLLYLKRR